MKTKSLLILLFISIIIGCGQVGTNVPTGILGGIEEDMSNNIIGSWMQEGNLEETGKGNYREILNFTESNFEKTLQGEFIQYVYLHFDGEESYEYWNNGSFTLIENVLFRECSRCGAWCEVWAHRSEDHSHYMLTKTIF